VHASSGLAVGTAAPLGYGLTILCALVLHLLLDLVPHWDYSHRPRRLWWASMDVLLAIAVVAGFTLTLGLSGRAVVAAMVSALPDLDVFDAVLPGGGRRRWFPSHWRVFPHGRARAVVGVPVQVLVLAGSLVTVAIVR
jgi:hypothetical protein